MSENRSSSGFESASYPEPTPEEVEKALNEIKAAGYNRDALAGQNAIKAGFPEFGDIGPDGKSDGDVIEEFTKQGWRLVEQPSGGDVVIEGVAPNEEVRIVGREDHSLVFRRRKPRSDTADVPSGAD